MFLRQRGIAMNNIEIAQLDSDKTKAICRSPQGCVD